MELEPRKWPTKTYNQKIKPIAKPLLVEFELDKHHEITGVFETWKLAFEVQTEI